MGKDITAAITKSEALLLKAMLALERREQGRGGSAISDADIAAELASDREIPLERAEQIVAEAVELRTRRARAQQRTHDAKATDSRNDMGNAKRLVKQHGHEIRYVDGKSWLAWTGKLWQPRALGTVERYAQQTAESIYDEAARAGKQGEKDRAQKLFKWAASSSNTSRIDGMMKMARSDVKVEARAEDFDTDLMALNVQNGVIDLTTGKLRPHNPDEMHSQIAGAALSWESPASWESFLEEVLPDAEVRHYVHKLAGYSITGEVGEHLLPFCCGGGANGKSVLLAVIRNVLGDYADEAAPELLKARRERGIPTDIFDLRGLRFVTTSEVGGDWKMADDVVKRLTGDDTLKARRMRHDFESFRNVTHLWLAANDKPKVDGLDEAIWRRIRLLPFTVTIPAADRDPRLIEKLLQERDGILWWLVQGCLAYQREGLVPPAGVAAATDDYRSESNPLLAWSEASCTAEADAMTSGEALHGSYVAWCGEDRYRGKPLSIRDRKWGAGLAGLGYRSKRTKDFRGWEGVRLNEVEPGVVV
jgi:putative DNA primase/helicase